MKLNLGAGNIIMEGYVNHDIREHRKEIDVCWDLNDVRWGQLVIDLPELNCILQPGFVDEIRAWDVLEHLSDPLNFFDNCWDLLKKDGILDMKICGWKNPNAYIDLTHKRLGFDILSFDYLDPDTILGKEYNYYTDKKWKIIIKGYDRKMNILIKLMPRKE